MASTPLLIPVGYQFLGNDGKPLSGGFLYTYQAGTASTSQNTYSDNALSVPNPNPIPLDSAGWCSVSGTEVNVYPLGGNYKLVLTDVNGVQIWSHDFVDPAAGWDILLNATLTNTTLVSPLITTSIVSSSALLNQLCQGRLTLTSGTPVTSADVTGATTIFFTPYGGRNIALYDGTANWTVIPFVETSLALGTLTSGLPYDVFGFNNSGVLGLELLAWTSTSARATALVLQDGVYSKSGVTTRRYLGTFFTTSTTQTEDSVLKRYVWNYYNRVPRTLQRFESTASWNYTIATIRQANGSTANQVSVVIGLQEVPIVLSLVSGFQNSNAAVNAAIGIGEDSTTTTVAGNMSGSAVAGTGIQNISLMFTKFPTIGSHTYSWNEVSTATGTTTWNGAQNVGGIVASSGLSGWIQG